MGSHPVAAGVREPNGLPPLRGLGTNGSPRDKGRVLVLNATYEPIHVCTVRRATVLLLKAKAELLEHGDRRLRAERLSSTGRS